LSRGNREKNETGPWEQKIIFGLIKKCQTVKAVSKTKGRRKEPKRRAILIRPLRKEKNNRQPQCPGQEGGEYFKFIH